ncbi:MAG: hypothetical protein AMXMBFR56_24520 [Polyangiaceae bacterium]
MHRHRHVFVQAQGPLGLTTSDWRGEAHVAQSGSVREAAYLVPARRSRSASWLSRALDWLATPLDDPRGSEPKLRVPSDATGGDRLGLCADELPGFDEGITLGELCSVSGTVIALEPRVDADPVVARDFWQLESPVWRLVEAVDFGVLPEKGPPVAVCCAMAPLLIAPVTAAPSERVEAGLGERAAGRMRELARRSQALSCLELREGDRVEVRGVVCEPIGSVTRFDVVERVAAYRGRPQLITRIVGDAPGTRLVIRKSG